MPANEKSKNYSQHANPFQCYRLEYSRKEGFRPKNDLDRHIKMKHPGTELGRRIKLKQSGTIRDGTSVKYRCRVPGCKTAEKSWPGEDEFRWHLRCTHWAVIADKEDYDVYVIRYVVSIPDDLRSSSVDQQFNLAAEMMERCLERALILDLFTSWQTLLQALDKKTAASRGVA